MGGLDELGLDLLDAMLVYDPAARISAKQAIIHPYFAGVVIPGQGQVQAAGQVPGTNGFAAQRGYLKAY